MTLTALTRAASGFDVEHATRAYLALLRGPARARSDAYVAGGYRPILWDAMAAVPVYGIVLVAGWSARFRDWAERTTRRRWLRPPRYALPFTIATTLLGLPWATTPASCANGSTG